MSVEWGAWALHNGYFKNPVSSGTSRGIFEGQTPRVQNEADVLAVEFDGQADTDTEIQHWQNELASCLWECVKAHYGLGALGAAIGATDVVRFSADKVPSGIAKRLYGRDNIVKLGPNRMTSLASIVMRLLLGEHNQTLNGMTGFGGKAARAVRPIVGLGGLLQAGTLAALLARGMPVVGLAFMAVDAAAIAHCVAAKMNQRMSQRG